MLLSLFLGEKEGGAGVEVQEFQRIRPNKKRTEGKKGERGNERKASVYLLAWGSAERIQKRPFVVIEERHLPTTLANFRSFSFCMRRRERQDTF